MWDCGSIKKLATFLIADLNMSLNQHKGLFNFLKHIAGCNVKKKQTLDIKLY